MDTIDTMEDKIFEDDHKSYNTSSAYKKRKRSRAYSDATEANSSLDFDGAQNLPFRLTKWRWLALAIMNFLLIGYFAVFDSPQPLQTAIMETMKINDQEYSYLYSFLAVPNLVLPLVAGYFVDVVGVRRSMLLFGIMVFVGQLILAYGAQILNFSVMLFGRVIYSLGADPLSIAQAVMVNRWFKGKELALALSLSTVMAGGGKAFCSMIVPALYESTHSLSLCFGYGAILCFFSLICIIIMVIWDKANDMREIALDPDYMKRTQSGENVNLRDLRKFKPLVWLVVFNFGIFDGIVFTLRSFLNDFYHKAYGYSNTKAGNYISTHYLVMAVASPLMGKFIDRYGLRASSIFYNSFLAILSLLLYVFVPTCNECMMPILPLIIFGLCIGIDDTATFSSLPLVLEEKYLGTGYGLCYVVENLVLTILPPMAGAIKGQHESEVTGYSWMIIFLLGFTIIGVIESFALLVVDRRNGRVLDKTICLEKIEPEDEHESQLIECVNTHHLTDHNIQNSQDYVKMT